MEWKTIETKPNRKAVLIFYLNELGKARTIKARFIPRYTEEADEEMGDCGEYFEAEDRYTAQEGWYEQIDNWPDYSEVFVHYQPTHWMPLPPAPPS